MDSPKEKDDVIRIAQKYHRWVAANGKIDLYPDELLKLDKGNNLFQFVFGVPLHFVLFLLTNLSKSIGLWSLVALFSKIRIATDIWSFEARQCGYNRAYTLLGLYRLRSHDINGAISALTESWKVYPCCHNTSFGLYWQLAKELELIPEAQDAVNDYKEIYRAFKA